MSNREGARSAQVTQHLLHFKCGTPDSQSNSLPGSSDPSGSSGCVVHSFLGSVVQLCALPCVRSVEESEETHHIIFALQELELETHMHTHTHLHGNSSLEIESST